MGNAAIRYMSNAEAIEVLGADTWTRLRRKLERLGDGSSIDFSLFCDVLHRRFEKMPRPLCECLYRAFAADLGRRVEVDVFLSTLAVPQCRSPELQARFLMRLYEEGGGGLGMGLGMQGGVVLRRRVTEVLQMAYGEKTFQLEALFPRGVAGMGGAEANTRQLEAFVRSRAGAGAGLELLLGWVRQALEAFPQWAQSSQRRLYALEARYSAPLETQQLARRLGLGQGELGQLRRTFLLLGGRAWSWGWRHTRPSCAAVPGCASSLTRVRGQGPGQGPEQAPEQAPEQGQSPPPLPPQPPHWLCCSSRRARTASGPAGGSPSSPSSVRSSGGPAPSPCSR
ncbi:hypothetical protein B484DRAFT_251274 [Ochromonadaceae sp. CCMP2298]|nr:hypothetical protein B484DRAFT_251274 [Ochromonadaceae sp. CCMP2298]